MNEKPSNSAATHSNATRSPRPVIKGLPKEPNGRRLSAIPKGYTVSSPVDNGLLGSVGDLEPTLDELQQLAHDLVAIDNLPLGSVGDLEPTLDELPRNKLDNSSYRLLYIAATGSRPPSR